MKLHLPKVLLTSLIAAVAIGQTATAEWAYPNSHPGYTTGAWYYFDKDPSKDTNTSYTTSESRLILNVTGDAATAEELRLCVDNVAEGNRTIYQLNLSDNNKRFDVAQTTWNASFTYKSLIIENLNLGAQGTGSAAFNVTYGHTVALQNVAGTLSSVSNVGKLTLGTEAGTTKLSGSISNSGTLTLKGNIELTGTSDLILDTTRSGEISYIDANGERGENGYRTVINAHYFLVENTAAATDAVDVSGASVTLSKGGSTQAVSLINDTTTGSVVLSVGDDVDRSWYYVNNNVNYGGEGGVNDAAGFALNGGILNLNSSLDSAVVTNGIKATTGTTSTLNLAGSDVVLNRDAITLEADSTVNLTGSGTVLVEGKSLNGDSSLGLSTGEGWTGVVELKDCTTSQPFAFTGFGDKLKLNGVKGTTIQALRPTADIEIAEGGWEINAMSNSTVAGHGNHSILTGAISGTGDLTVYTTVAKQHAFELFLQGDTSEWSGDVVIKDNDLGADGQARVKLSFNGGGSAFAADGESTITSNRSNGAVEVFVGKSGETTQMNAAVVNAGNGTVTVVAEHDTVFNKSLDVTSLEVRANATATLKAETTTGSFSLGDGGKLTLAGGTLTVTDSITLSTVAVEDLAKYFAAATQLEDKTYSVDLVTAAGGINDWAGAQTGTYMADGTEYTTTVDLDGNSIVLTFKGPDDVVEPGITSLVVGDISLTGTVLTLIIGQEDLTGMTGDIDLTLSDSALAKLALLPAGEVSLLLQGTGDPIDSRTYGDDISFYGSYVGEGDGKYRVEYIPEPATATLSLLALAGLAARRRRK